MKPISNVLEFAFLLRLLGKPENEERKTRTAIFIYYLLKRGLIEKDFVYREGNSLDLRKISDIERIMSMINGKDFSEFIIDMPTPKEGEVKEVLYGPMSNKTYKELIPHFSFEKKVMIAEFMVIWLMINKFYDNEH